MQLIAINHLTALISIFPKEVEKHLEYNRNKTLLIGTQGQEKTPFGS